MPQLGSRRLRQCKADDDQRAADQAPAVTGRRRQSARIEIRRLAEAEGQLKPAVITTRQEYEYQGTIFRGSASEYSGENIGTSMKAGRHPNDVYQDPAWAS